MRKHPTQLSKYLSYLLRHGAEEAGLALDHEGFAALEELWALVERRYGQRFTHEHLALVVAGDHSGKKRFERSGDRIRAMYGHNRKLAQTIQYENVAPPTYLYHGTTPQAWPKIQEEGLSPMQRQYVHLAVGRQRAYDVARRYDPSPIMLRVQARAAYDAGHPFYQPEVSHYLTEVLPPIFIEIDPDERG